MAHKKSNLQAKFLYNLLFIKQRIIIKFLAYNFVFFKVNRNGFLNVYFARVIDN